MTHTRFGKEYVEWAPGVLIQKDDAAALYDDFSILGTAYVETIGGYGRRIPPENILIRHADKPESN
jgi:hypothetical protein